MKKITSQFMDGLLYKNPVLIQLLGMCSTLAITTSAENAFGMGIAATAVLVCSNFLISALRKFIPEQIRIAAYIVLISGFVTAVELIIKAYLPSLDKSLGIFIPLIVVNCIILARAEAFASKNKVLPSVIDGLAMGIGFTAVLLVLGIVREIIGAGTVFGHRLFGADHNPVLMIASPAGGFLTLGILLAFVQKLLKRGKKADSSANTADTENMKERKD